ncbi:MAG: N-acetyltransferase [Planctomycetes bacterium]|nr:N-acetyltransferase [Planctomycetota bacterium]
MTSPGYVAHPSSIVDPGCEIGEGTRIWHFCHISTGARIGARCVLGQNVYVAPTARLGDGCKIQNNVSLYDGVELESEVFCGPSMVFTNVTHPRAHVSRKGEYEKTRVGRRATLGANATVLCGVTLGAYCFIAAGSVVTRDVPPYALMAGVPARLMGWVCGCGERLPGAGEGPLACGRCAARYTLRDEGLVPEATPA